MLDKTPYTPNMREVLKLSKAEAGRLGHDYIGAEHYLLAIIRKGDGLAVQTLINLDVDLGDLKLEMERMMEMGRAMPMGLFAPNADAKRVLETAKIIALEMRHGWVGTEHLLLALIKEEHTLANKCLRHFGVDYENAHDEVLTVIEGCNPVSRPKPAHYTERTRVTPVIEIWTRMPVGPDVTRALEIAGTLARKMAHEQVWPEHLLLAILKDEQSPVSRYLARFGIDYPKAKEDLLHPLIDDDPDVK